MLAWSAPALQAQVLYGSLVGTVQDPTGGVVPNATVTITNRGTSQTQETTTGGNGGYVLTNVLGGIYDLRVTADGFRTFSQENISVTVNTVRRIEVTLEVGQVTETVTVEAAALSLQTDKADVHVDLSPKAIVNMPLPNYRNYQTLINLVPGATPGRFQNSTDSTPARSLSVNVNGVNRNNNGNKLDGAVNVFIWLPHHAAYVAPAETIETVNISTNNFDADQGMAGGAAVNVTTKSGTNELHGSAFAFHDNQRLRAKNFFSPGAKPKNITNIDGFTVGGPIKKDKIFFFGGWEGYRERQGYERTSMTVATADQREGNFSAYSNAKIFDPLTGNADGTGRTQFTNNIVPLDRQSPITRQMQALVPLPNKPGVSGNFRNVGTASFNRDNFDAKVNWAKSTSMQIWGKYSLLDSQHECFSAFGEGGGLGLCNSAAGDASVKIQLATIGMTKTFSPTFLYDAVYGWTRTDEDIVGKDFGVNFGLDVLGIPGTNGDDPRQGGQPAFVINSYDTLGNPSGWQPTFYNDTTFATEHNFTWIKGSHDIRFGFQGLRHHMNHWQPELGGGPRGQFRFNPGVTGLKGGPAQNQYNSYAGFLLGLPEIMQKSLQFEKMGIFEYQMGWYVRDRWQVSSKLTLSLGLRYERYPLMTRPGRGGIEEWDSETNQVLLGGAGGNPKDLGVATSNKLFAPRLGLAFRLSDKTVIRSGYGITFNPQPLARSLRGFYPLVIANDYNSPNAYQAYAPIAQGIPEFVLPDVDSGSIPLPPTALMRFINGDRLNRGYVQSWNFVIERQLPAGFLTSVGYIGTRTVRSFADINTNASFPGGGTAGRTYAPFFGRTVDTLAWNGFLDTNYHSLQLSINRQAADGLTLKGAYTYSAAINYTDDDGWATVSWNYLPHFERNRARAVYDQPHIFQLGWVYELPFGAGKSHAQTGLARAVLGDWQFNGMASMFQGRRFTLSSSNSSLNAPGNIQTPDQVKPEVEKVGGVGPGQFFFDPTAFAPVTDVRFGSVGRNTMLGPGTVNFAFGLFRKFPITERWIMEFRAESYNATNTPHFMNPGANRSAADFMQVLSAQQDQRQFRMGLRMQW
jgi:hypothetical protein